jgi:hypothetical protein
MDDLRETFGADARRGERALRAAHLGAIDLNADATATPELEAHLNGTTADLAVFDIN